MKIIKNRYIYLFLITIIALLIIISLFNFIFPKTKKIDTDELSQIKLPENFKINIFADLSVSSRAYPGPNPGPRFMEFKDDNLFLSVSKQGKVVAMPDKNKDNKADEIIEVINDLNNPHGLAFYQDWLYIAEEDKIIRIKDLNNDLIYELESKEIVVDNLPEGGHWTRTIKIFDNNLYISIGSGCNVCEEKDERRASILKCTIEGKNCKVFASGTRNAVGFVFHPSTNEIYATENSRDLLGENIPPDEINIIKEGKDYGWPYCYANNIPDPFGIDIPGSLCLGREPSFVNLQAHSAPLGLTFYNSKQFPKEFQGDLFVAYHGSWNRKIPTGYKIVVIDLETKQVEDFATGWLTDDSKVLGRPVDVIVDTEGSMFVSDDNAGLIYKITYNR